MGILCNSDGHSPILPPTASTRMPPCASWRMASRSPPRASPELLSAHLEQVANGEALETGVASAACQIEPSILLVAIGVRIYYEAPLGQLGRPPFLGRSQPCPSKHRSARGPWRFIRSWTMTINSASSKCSASSNIRAPILAMRPFRTNASTVASGAAQQMHLPCSRPLSASEMAG